MHKDYCLQSIQEIYAMKPQFFAIYIISYYICD